jgi:hypothetical protein
MAQKSNETDPRFDKRVYERLVARGTLTKAEVEKHLSSLKDVADQADNIADLVYGQTPSEKANVQ